MIGLDDPYAAIAQPAQAAPPPAPPSAGEQDPYAGIASPAQPTPHMQMADNPNKEPVYRMSSDDGTEVGIPYSKIATGPALHTGFRFVDPREEGRFLHTYLHDPQGSFTKALSYQLGQDPIMRFYSGVGKSALDTLYGLGKLMTPFLNDEPPEGQQQGDLAQAVNRPAEGFMENAGEAGGNVAQFTMGEQVLKALPELMGAEKLAVASKITKLAEAHPILAEALRQGLTAAGQTFAQGGEWSAANAEHAAVAGGSTAAVAGTLGGVSSLARNAVAKRATTLEKVGGVEMPVSAEARNAKMTPAQQSGQQAIRKVAQAAGTRNLGELEQSRTPPAGPLALPAKTGPFEFNLKGTPATETPTGEIGQGAAKFPRTHSQVPPGATPAAVNTEELGSTARTVPDRMLKREEAYLTSSARPTEAAGETVGGGGTVTTQDPNIARAHIANLNDVIESDRFPEMEEQQQRQLLEARADAQRQMADYHEQVLQPLEGPGRRNFEPIDIPKEVAGMGSISEAGEKLEQKAVEGYNVMNDATGGRFNAVRQELKDAWNGYKGASGEDAQQAAEAHVTAAEAKMTKLIAGLRGVVNDRELDGFNDAFRNAQGLKRIGAAVDGSFQGNPSTSARSFEYRGFDGGRLMANLSRLERTMGRPAIDRLLGPGHMDTLYQVAELNRTQAQRAKFGADVVAPIAKSLITLHTGPAAVGGVAAHMAGMPWEAGAVAGIGTAWASRKVMSAILTDPQIARNVIYALDKGAKPESYGPFIAGLIAKGAKDYADSQRATQNGGQ